ncbi:hypothetical protein A3B87_00640 [Candidatus Kuenenbacteria bacterium RIFCSPHIGHO2_02_FULL_39_13]|uniref:DUF559 domain-containing protein n=1 Tax=Candidatus Kuenenbacteria bacterium RIFCSPHIGHO2_02_FULL_39_13 TaxID=1798561 RepID=A0A1F6FP24_9BACT|nr:MAG: hypothetical protein A3B87_00640 [Candidatus Kuenenbacteria bacterium RIFCSPHIGHO2_02_FULL_39_13]
MTVIFNQHKYKQTRQLLRNNSTKAERILWNHLNGNQIGIKFRRQYSIGDYIADFCAPRKKLIIELDGGIHLVKNQRLYDKARQLDIEHLGFRVIRFANKEIAHNLDKVLDKIKKEIKI